MSSSTNQNVDLKTLEPSTLKPKIWYAILSRVKPLHELAEMRFVCRKFNILGRQVLTSVEVLELNRICREVTSILFPIMPKLKIIKKTKIDAELREPNGYFASGYNLARDCPELEYFHDASPSFILSYVCHLERQKKRPQIKLVRAEYDTIAALQLVTLLSEFPHIDIFADRMPLDRFIGTSSIYGGHEDIGPRIVTMRTVRFSVRLSALFTDMTFSSLSDLKKMLQMWTRLKALAIALPVQHVSLIPIHCPSVEHLRIEDTDQFKQEYLDRFRDFIAKQAPRYSSFGLSIKKCDNFAITREILHQMFESRVKFRCGPEELNGTCLIFGPHWSVEVKSFNRKFVTHINSWQPRYVPWLRRLFPSADYRPIRHYAVSPRSRHGPLEHADILEYLHLPNIRALYLKLSADHVNLINQSCPRLRHLRLRIIERVQKVDIESLTMFLMSKVGGYETFSFAIDEPVTDEEAKAIVNILVKMGAKFRYTEEFGHPFLQLGRDWYVTSCKCFCVRRWLVDSIKMFIDLFRPTKKIHIIACGAGSEDANRWTAALTEFFKSNKLKRTSIDFAPSHDYVPSPTDF